METKSPASLMRGITGISFRQSVIRFWIIQAFIYLNKTKIFKIKDLIGPTNLFRVENITASWHREEGDNLRVGLAGPA
jgi:hypothetical protein